MPLVDSSHYREVAKQLRLGKVIPFLGAGVNLCDRPATLTAGEWMKSGYLPRGGELAQSLAKEFDLPTDENPDDLMRVSRYVQMTKGETELYQFLQTLLAKDYKPTRVHRFFARLCKSLQDKPPPPPVFAQPVLLTTNYDRVLEAAFQDEGVKYDVVFYAKLREGIRATFWHLPDAELHYCPQPGVDAPWVQISDPKTYMALPIGKRPVIVKIHGAVDRDDVDKCSFVVTEDDYIDYMTSMDLAAPLSKQLMAKLRTGQFLFLGYGLRDWNLRVILQRLWCDKTLSSQSWAIDQRVSYVDEKSWRKWNVDLLEAPLAAFMEGLGKEMQIDVAPPTLAPESAALPVS